MKTGLVCTAFILALISSPVAFAQNKTENPSLELSADASRMAPNDLARVRVYIEQTGAAPDQLAKTVNQRMAELIAMTKPYSAVKTSSAGVNTYPVYDKEGQKITAWRMRSELSLESRDMAAMSELIGKLQSIAVVSQLMLTPSPETQKRVADEAMVDAIKAFQARASVAAQALGKRYRLSKLSIDSNTNMPRPMPVYAMKAAPSLSSAAAPAPIEAGGTAITVNVRGTVDLTD